MYWFFKCLRQYFDFKGRARRKEYWMFYLWALIIEVVIYGLSLLLGGGLPGIGFDESVPPELMPRNVGMGMFFTGLITLYGFAILIPQLAVTVRRLHDIGKSGWLLLLIYLLIFAGIGLMTYYSVTMLANGPETSMVPFWIGLSIIIAVTIWFIALMVKKGDVGRNKYGEDPKSTF